MLGLRLQVLFTLLKISKCSEAPATCIDGIKNQGETGIDCGGPCWNCEPRLEGVCCGRSMAPSCSECPKGSCSGNCFWVKSQNQCVDLDRKFDYFCFENEDCLPSETCRPMKSNTREYQDGMTWNMTKGSQINQNFKQPLSITPLEDLKRQGCPKVKKCPAVYLDYNKDAFDDKFWEKIKWNGWSMTVSTIVQKTVPRTYYKTVGFGEKGSGYIGFTHSNGKSIQRCGGKAICGKFQFSLWDNIKEGHKVTLVSKGDGVDAHRFGHEGTGYHSSKYLDWLPNEEIFTEVTAEWEKDTNSWTVEGKMKIRDKTHILAKFRRGGETLHEKFKFSSWIEEFFSTGGCLYQRSAVYKNPTLHFMEDGVKKHVRLDTASFTYNKNPAYACDDWACADSGKNFFSLTTGGARMGKPKREKCHQGQMFKLDPTYNPFLTGPLKRCEPI